MASPEYLICLECETPCYVFEWEDGKISRGPLPGLRQRRSRAVRAA